VAVCFNQGQVIGRGDLDLYLTNASGNPANAYEISYAIYCVDPTTCAEVLIGSDARTPVNPAVGEYYAALQIPPNASIGGYHIRWTFREFAGAPQQQVVQEFCVVGQSVSTATTSITGCRASLISKLRFMLRDTNPDKYYHFRPPEGEGVIGCYNQVNGFIWTDEELLQFLEIALWKWNMHPPETEYLGDLDALCTMKPVWQAAILWGGIVNAAMALAINWIADEFDYSIGGISLNLERSSKYMDIKRNAEEQFDKLTEAKARTTKYIRGLAQPRYGRGVRSAFGPATGRGVLSPRSFVVFPFAALNAYYILQWLQAGGASGIL
jgi:hypothetical protein